MSCHVHLGLWLFVIFVSILFLSLYFKKHYQHQFPFFLITLQEPLVPHVFLNFYSVFLFGQFNQKKTKILHCFSNYCRPSINQKNDLPCSETDFQISYALFITPISTFLSSILMYEKN